MAPTAVNDKPATDSTGEQPQSTAMTPAQPSAPPAAAQPSKVPIRMGLAPQTLEEAWRMSQFMAQSELVPKVYRNKPADVLVAIQYGMELGFAPMQALQSIAVVNGRPSVWGDGFLALIMASPLYRDHDEYYEVAGQRHETITIDDLKKDDTAAICTFWRHGKTLPTTRRFSVGQAKKASLLGKEGPWSTYPDRMLAMRARGFSGRDAFPDLLRGIRTAEEALDTQYHADIDVQAAPEPVQPRRASEARTAPASEPAAASPRSSEPASTAAAQTAEPPAADGGSIEARGLLIMKTGFIRPKTGEPYYQIIAKTSTNREVTFITRDEAVYKEAASFEGTDHAVVVWYADARPTDKDKVLVLQRLAIYEGGGTPAEPALFN